MIYKSIDAIDDFFRRHIKRDSWTWNTLRLIILSWQKNPISRHTWKQNHKAFEQVIEDYSRETEPFFVIQVGANDGVRNDPIHKWVKKYKWHGILIEPQKQLFEELKSNYAHESENLIFENLAIADREKTGKLYKVKDDQISMEWQRGIASLLPKAFLGEKDSVDVEMVKCITFDMLLNRNDVKKIDFLQIDVEGYDYEIIKQVNFDKIKPRLIRYEHMHLKLADKKACKKLLKKMGYRILEMEFDTGAQLITVNGL